MSEIILIAAIGRNREIGWNNRLPWHLPDDLKRFKALTRGAAVVMGRNTWESLGGRPLAERRNVLVSRTLAAFLSPRSLSLSTSLPSSFAVLPPSDPSALSSALQRPTTLEIYSSLTEALLALAQEPRIFIIGGAQLYAAALPLAHRLELTEVDAAPPADCYFPPWSPDDFYPIAVIPHPADARHPFSFRFTTYIRRSPPCSSPLLSYSSQTEPPIAEKM
ncbi:MAG: dihydrofolate reductase [Hydrogenophilus sp.]|nr:dihydrofolate reductase [Hydrogenophilus sp.]